MDRSLKPSLFAILIIFLCVYKVNGAKLPKSYKMIYSLRSLSSDACVPEACLLH